ncbi:hypothetical protein J155_02597 [Xanthomonas citri pv. citri]|uniref:Uncharacterized protein n=1 Tax=Xanthomonas citri pv. citri TaxID=611301 RepID=A0A0U5FDP0_XANCI|nr:Hypothetical Protein XCAW_02100 [Xanthomonas citri subsp. citri Aw12879]AJD69026.1 hypothetical protein J151_02606 [Xanthomonas citri subsp. citri A306]AJY82551.1 hypothetical protein J159_02594 [Xanthomonas citri pv. citri]AJY86975.1 hypothetical protein J158_02596 [Xanthomonas citri subsp. citri UI6]AJY91406.1 hypothetical protein J169_02603 [Xanthomonas citri pv. citri]
MGQPKWTIHSAIKSGFAGEGGSLPAAGALSSALKPRVCG